MTVALRCFLPTSLVIAATALASAALAQDASPPAASPAETPAAASDAAVAPAAPAPPAPAPSAGMPTTSPDLPGALTAPPAGKGQVVFFRPGAYAGMMVSFTITEASQDVAKVGNNNYAVYTVDPGAHSFTIKSEATDTLNMEIDKGETYYVKETLGMGVLLYRPHLTPSDQATFEKGVKGWKLVAPKSAEVAQAAKP